jgi:hypothetical protein
LRSSPTYKLVIALCFALILVNYKEVFKAAFVLPFENTSFDQLLAIVKLCALALAVFIGAQLLKEPITRLLQYMPVAKPETLVAELEDAQEYAAEILRRLIRGLPFEVLLLKIAGAEKKHIHNYEDKVKYKTVGVIMTMVGIYVVLAIYYLVGEIGNPLIDMSKFDEFPGKDAAAWGKFINAFVAQHPLVIGLIFGVFVVAIDRLIISDHSLEYRLFKIRLQQWANPNTPPGPTAGRTLDIRSSDRSRSSSIWKFWQWKYLTWYWLRSRPLILPSAAGNVSQWSLDAAALFHPRAFFSTILVLTIRLLFAYYTSILVTNAFLLKFYDKDVRSQIFELSAEFETAISNCPDLSKPSLGCEARRAEQKQKTNADDIVFYDKVANEESQPSGIATVFCRYVLFLKLSGATSIEGWNTIPKKDVSPQKLCEEIGDSKYKQNDKITYTVLTPELTTGRKSQDDKAGRHETGLKDRAKAAKDEKTDLDQKYKLAQDAIKDSIREYKTGISVRLEALQRISRAPPKRQGSVSSDLTSGTSADASHYSTLYVALRFLLMGFEMIPVLMLKVIPLFGWMPTLYIWSYCTERISKEKEFGKKLTFEPWPIRTMPEIEAGDLNKYSNEIGSERFKTLDPAALVIGLLTSLRLPIVIISAIVFGVFSLAKSLATYVGLSP